MFLNVITAGTLTKRDHLNSSSFKVKCTSDVKIFSKISHQTLVLFFYFVAAPSCLWQKNWLKVRRKWCTLSAWGNFGKCRASITTIMAWLPPNPQSICWCLQQCVIIAITTAEISGAAVPSFIPHHNNEAAWMVKYLQQQNQSAPIDNM